MQALSDRCGNLEQRLLSLRQAKDHVGASKVGVGGEGSSDGDFEGLQKRMIKLQNGFIALLEREPDAKAFFKAYEPGEKSLLDWHQMLEEQGLGAEAKFELLVSAMEDLEESVEHIETMQKYSTKVLELDTSGMKEERMELHRSWRTHEEQKDRIGNLTYRANQLITDYHDSVVGASNVYLAFDEVLSIVERDLKRSAHPNIEEY